MASEPVQDGLKRCPDCAETIKAQARVCRFCGYRFESPPAADQAATGGPDSVPELLQEWGTTLGNEERVAFFTHAHIRLVRPGTVVSTDGFLVLTGLRLLFFIQPRRRFTLKSSNTPAELLVERAMHELGYAKLLPRWHRAGLRLGDDLELSGIHPRARLHEVHRFVTVSQPETPH